MDGTVFDSTDGQALPALFRVRDLIMGWQIALVRMHEGDKFRVWIPAKYAYGSAKMDMIPAWSTLEFDIELVKMRRYDNKGRPMPARVFPLFLSIYSLLLIAGQ